jgi:hypothetical protein
MRWVVSLHPKTTEEQGLTLVHFSAQRKRSLLGPELDRQSGTFVDTKSEIRAKRLSDCLPIGGSQIDAAFFKRILISKLEVQGKEANHFD